MADKRTIKITRSDLNEMINRVVREVLNEKNGVIDQRFLNLADWIIAKYERGVKKNRWGERTFTIPSNVFQKYNIYDLPFKNLKVEVISYGNDKVRGHGDWLTLCLRDDTLRNHDRTAIAHEFVHLVQQKDPKESEKFNEHGHWALSKYSREITAGIAYNFDPHEMAARLSEAYTELTTSQRFTPENVAQYIKGTGAYTLKNLNYFNDFYRLIFKDMGLYRAFRLDYMIEGIHKIEKDTAEDFNFDMTNTLLKFRNQETFDFGRISSPVFGIFMSHPWYLKNVIPDYHKLLGEGEQEWKNGHYNTIYRQPGKDESTMWFIILQRKILDYFKRSFDEYKKKIQKTLAGPIQELYEQVLPLLSDRELKYHDSGD